MTLRVRNSATKILDNRVPSIPLGEEGEDCCFRQLSSCSSTLLSCHHHLPYRDNCHEKMITSHCSYLYKRKTLSGPGRPIIGQEEDSHFQSHLKSSLKCHSHSSPNSESHRLRKSPRQVTRQSCSSPIFTSSTPSPVSSRVPSSSSSSFWSSLSSSTSPEMTLSSSSSSPSLSSYCRLGRSFRSPSSSSSPFSCLYSSVFCNSNFITTTLLSLILITSGLLQFAGKITITSDQFSSLLLERV